MITISCFLGYWIRFPETLFSFNFPTIYWLVITIYIITSYLVFSCAGIYRAWRGKSIVQEMRLLMMCCAIIVAILTTVGFLTHTSEAISRLWFGYSMLIALFGLLLFRTGVRLSLRWARSKGYNQKLIVVLGAGDLARTVGNNLGENNWSGLKIAAFFDDDKNLHGEKIGDARIVGYVDEIYEYIENLRKEANEFGRVIDEVWITLPLSENKKIKEVVNRLQDSSTSIIFVPDLYGFNLLNYSLEEVTGMPVVNVSGSSASGVGYMIKTFMDKTLAFSILFFTWPFMLIISLIIKIESKGPAIFAQTRYGLRGQEITIWKFRTMRVEENGNKIPQATKNDSRTTKFGRFLRRTSLDEWPQFINVLQGRMSIVGPRPHAAAHNEIFRKQIKNYMIRHRVRPGITGLSQIKGYRGELRTKEQLQKRLEYDLQYIEKWSLWLDIKIIFTTIFKGLIHKNAY